MFAALRRRRRLRRLAAEIHRALVERARAPHLYARLGVPDTFEGRFELAALFVVAFAREAARRGGGTAELGQAVVDAFFADLDRAVREMGVGDLSVGKHVRRLGELFLHRSRSLCEALDRDDPQAAAALLARNLPDLPPAGARAVAEEVFAFARHLARAEDPVAALQAAEAPARNAATTSI
ncbi:hypothetical protein HRbin39_00608 [bacterium HR39]|nr:hypothetical protein HRbin39_00608 [bacterium HR39]